VREATPQYNAARGGARERHRHPSRHDRSARVCDIGTARHRPAALLRRPSQRAPPITISLDTEPRTWRGRPDGTYNDHAAYAQVEPLLRGLLQTRRPVNDTSRSSGACSELQSRRSAPRRTLVADGCAHGGRHAGARDAELEVIRRGDGLTASCVPARSVIVTVTVVAPAGKGPQGIAVPSIVASRFADRPHARAAVPGDGGIPATAGGDDGVQLAVSRAPGDRSGSR
jgi:hypothetical protein